MSRPVLNGFRVPAWAILPLRRRLRERRAARRKRAYARLGRSVRTLGLAFSRLARVTKLASVAVNSFAALLHDSDIARAARKGAFQEDAVAWPHR